MKTNTNNSKSNGLKQQFAINSANRSFAENKLAVVYNRSATDNQDSLDIQQQAAEKFCHQNQWNLVKSWNVNESGLNVDKKAFREMLRFCEDNQIGHIVVYSYDRISRSGDLSELKRLHESGIKVRSVTQSPGDQTESGRIAQAIFQMFAEMERL